MLQSLFFAKRILGIWSILVAAIAAIANAQDGANSSRFVLDLQQGWTVEVVEGTGSDVVAKQRIPIEIGREFESVLGERFDGKVIYRTKLDHQIPVDEYQRWWLEIDGAATAAVVKIDGTEVGRHLGGWTPFRCDVTAWLKKRTTTQAPEVEIEVDELVGHNTQGFLPIVVPHFGGIWKTVRLVGQKSEAQLDDYSLRTGGYGNIDQLEMEVPVILPQNQTVDEFQVDFRIENGIGKDKQWQPLNWDRSGKGAVAKGIYTPERKQRWTPANPFLYQMQFRLSEKRNSRAVDVCATTAAIREIKVDGRRLLLNGEPLAVRGLLNWGYAPPRLSPTLDEKWMESELREAKQRGFNLMKICLWIPPKRYLELADEMGMLLWMEYPTWHPDFSEKKLKDLKQEFREFFHYDRNHPSVIVRSLTCETGVGADLKVIQELYDLAHAEVPGSVVEDDSSWIQWNRVSDFYDDHPYGNNHTWRKKLDELDRYITEREPKPLLLGEAIAADTWVTRESLAAGGAAAATVHAPLSAEKWSEYVGQLSEIITEKELSQLSDSSKRYALLMRKFQIETYRDHFPDQGYVVSVIRDFPLASMGLIDRANRWKWTPADFDWHRDRLLVLRTANDRRSFVSKEKVEFEMALIGASKETAVGPMTCTLQVADTQKSVGAVRTVPVVDNAGRFVAPIEMEMPQVSEPTMLRLTVTASQSETEVKNSWDLWVLPERTQDPLVVYSHGAIQEWLGTTDTWPIEFLPWDQKSIDRVIVTRRWDPVLWQAAVNGARVVMLPDNSTGSLALREHWFLRGGPIAGGEHPFWEAYSKEMVCDVQHFDWSGPVMFDSPLIDAVTPLVLLWDNHDLKHYRSHLLAFDCRVGRGRWIASTLGLGNGVDRSDLDLLQAWIESIQKDSDKVQALSPEWLEAIQNEIGSRAVSLAQADWKFSPDRDDVGVSAEWFGQDHDRSGWKPITIDRHWESHGYEGLDGWGWYHAEVEIPAELRRADASPEEDLYIHFTGADDYFELFVDEKQIGSGGDRELRQTAFELRKSFVVPREAIEDGRLSIAVRILDWQGAGGLFRPIYLSNRPIRETAPVLVEAR